MHTYTHNTHLSKSGLGSEICSKNYLNTNINTLNYEIQNIMQLKILVVIKFGERVLKEMLADLTLAM